jgi:hypothetical protein
VRALKRYLRNFERAPLLTALWSMCAAPAVSLGQLVMSSRMMLRAYHALCSLMTIAFLMIWITPLLLGEEATASLTIREAGFEPTTLEVKAGVKFGLIVKNTTSKAAEFESSELNREKIVPAGSNVRINIGPLKPGSYPYVDDFNKSHRGTIVAK